MSLLPSDGEGTPTVTALPTQSASRRGLARVVTFGELLLRLVPPDNRLLEQAPTFEVGFAGAEANVAVSVARFGLDACYVSRMPDNPMSRAGRRLLEGCGVDTSQVLDGGDRLGIYFVEQGVAQRPSRVLYDRGSSGMASIEPKQIPWSSVLDGCAWFHTSGITPALSQSAAAATAEAVIAARAAGATVSIDLNYRAQLWRWGRTPREVMTELVNETDVVVGNEEDLEKVFGIAVPAFRGPSLDLDPRAYEPACDALRRMFPQLRAVAVTVRTSVSASDNFWTGVLATDSGFFTTRRYHITPVLDRLGAGDAFAAGIIRGMLQNPGAPQATLDFAVAASCLKHSIRGDFNLLGVDEVLHLAHGDTSGRIVR